MDQILKEAVDLIRDGLCEDGLSKLESIASDRLEVEDEVDYLFWKGTALFHLNLYDEAERVIRLGLRRFPKESRFHRCLGQLLSDSGREEESLFYFARVAEMLPDDFLNAYEWGLALYKLEQDDEAIERFEDALRAEPRCSGAVQYLGDIFCARGETEKALQVYQAYLDRSPRDSAMLVEAAICLSDLGQFREAFACYERAVDAHPGYLYAYYNWAVSLWRSGQLDDALQKVRQCLDVDGQCPLAWILWGRLDLARGQTEDGFGKLERGIRLAREPEQDDVDMIAWCYEAYFDAMLDLHRLEDAESIFWEAGRGNLLTQPMLDRHSRLFAEECDGLSIWWVLLDVRLPTPVPVKELEGDCASGYFCGFNVLARNPDEAVDHAVEFERHLGTGDAVAEEVLPQERNVSGVPGVTGIHPNRDYYSAHPEYSV